MNNNSKNIKVEKFVYKQASVWLSKKEGKFFDDKQYSKVEAKFKRMAKTNVVDWYLVDEKDDKVLVTLVNYIRKD